jgi:hypothetical protein
LVFGVARTSQIVGAGVLLLGVALAAGVGLGIFAKNPPAVAGVLATLARRAPVPAGVTLAILVVGGAMGFSARGNEQRAIEQKCADGRSEAQSAIGRNNYPAARDAVRKARGACDPSVASELAALEQEIDEKEPLYQNRRAEEDAAIAAERAAAKERRAVETFPTRTTEINEKIKAASTHATKKEWEKAGEELTEARSILASFAGTSVEKAKEWSDLDAKITAQEKRIAPELDKIREKQRAEQAAAQAEVDARGPEPLQSAWDGELPAVKNYLMDVLKDPDSYKHDKCTKPRAEGRFWVVACSYRAKNSFGAVVKEAQTFYIRKGGLAGEGQVVRAERLQ